MHNFLIKLKNALMGGDMILYDVIIYIILKCFLVFSCPIHVYTGLKPITWENIQTALVNHQYP